MDFSTALQNLKNGKHVQRQGWNGKGMFLFLIPANSVIVGERKLAPFIAIKDAQNNLVPWLASQTDLLAEDWQLAK